jgi:diguanylate cyclase (GGDEF)-like protein
MRAQTKFAVVYLLALLPLTVTALAWTFLAYPFQRADLATLMLGAVLVGAAAPVRIQLPKTNAYLALSDTIVLFSLLYFGGEFAIVMAAIGSIVSATWRFRRGHVIDLFINICISITTVFVTSVGLLTLFGEPDTVLVKLGNWTFLLVTAVLAGVPLITNILLSSATSAIRGERGYWQELKNSVPDAVLVYIGAALMAGLGAMAVRDTNIFLLFTVAAFFAILQIAFGRYRNDYARSKQEAAASARERSRLGEKHVAELKHYIDELERSSQALRESREKYRHAAYHDSLTGLPNRNRFLEVIDRLIQRCQHVPSHTFGLIYLDLHRFKTVNDSLGHAIGDELIKSVATRLSAMVSGEEIVGRFSGDEFAILLPDIANSADVVAFAEQVLERVAQPFTLERRQIFTNVSAGIAIGSSKYLQAADVLRDADIAMYRAKERKRSIVTFEENMHVQALSLLQLETDLRLAVERKEFELFYQPIVDLDSMTFAGVEALVRWSHPEFGHINPEKFIELAESTGLIVPMTLQIMSLACGMLKEWNGRSCATASPLFVSINLSGKHFNHPDVVEHISTILDETGVDPSCIKLEITETAVMDNAERASLVLKQIKALGVQLSIDDFGTGYSSLSYLQRFPIDTLKIDRSFVRSMEDGQQNGEIVRMILALADAMKLSVVAEGIESVHQLHQLRILNCRYGQGYLFSHPLPIAEIESLLKMPNRWENLVSGSTFTIVPPSVDAPEERVH